MNGLRISGWLFMVVLAPLFGKPGSAAEVYDLGSRRELFVDRQQIESTSGSARLRLHSPVPAEIALKFDSPWDGPLSAYVTVFRDGDKVRMYYRGWQPNEPGGEKGNEYACYAESTDGGKTFTKPKLGLFEAGGSKENNIVWGHPSHNFAPFKDERPGVSADERYKAIKSGRKGQPHGLFALFSADGIHWRQGSDVPLITKGAFDSQNLAFWDAATKQYRSYFRTFTKGVVVDGKYKASGIRAVSLATSADFVTWSEPKTVALLGDAPQEHFYTNATTPYFRAPNYYFMFPKRFVKDRSGREGFSGISDGMFLSSRDGLHFDRTFLEAFIPPGRDPENWGDRSTMPVWGLIQTGPDEMSVYYSQHYRQPTAHVRRGVLRLDGIASLRADGSPGELITKPFTFTGKRLTMNYATSAAGNMQVEIQTADGSSIPGFSLTDAPEAFGDKIDAAYAWKNGADVSSLAGKPVRLRFVLRDADVYSYRFAE